MLRLVHKLASYIGLIKHKRELSLPDGLCYFMVCFSRVDFVRFLLASLYRPNDLFIIHCDRKSPIALKKYVDAVSLRYKNIVQIESQDYSWAGYSHVKITLEAITIASATSKQWTHCLFLSEQHLPLKKPEDIQAYLAPRKSLVFMRSAATMTGGELADIENRFAAVYRELQGVGCFAIGLAAAEKASIAEVYHGSNWMILHRDHCQILLDAERADGFERFRHVVHAEETAIHSVLAPLAHEIENRDAILVAHPHLTDNHSLVMTEDLCKAATEQDYIFIRKRTDVLSDYVRGFIIANHFVEDIEALGDPQSMFKPRAPSRHPSEEHLETCQAFFHTSALAPVKIDRIDPLLFGYVPKIHLILSTPRMRDGLSVRILSENLENYKVCLVEEKAYGIFDRPYVENDVLHSTLRARLFGLFGYTDILPLDIEDSGFLSIRSSESRDDVYRLAARLLAFAENYTIGGVQKT